MGFSQEKGKDSEGHELWEVQAVQTKAICSGESKLLSDGK